MKNTDSEVMRKIMEITKLKKEIIQLILPENTYKHLESIGDELKAMVMESVCKSNEKSDHQTSVKKVNID
jgi:hypothetical protein